MSRGTPAWLALPLLRTCPNLPAPVAARAGEPGLEPLPLAEPAPALSARSRPPGRWARYGAIAGHWLGPLFRTGFEYMPRFRGTFVGWEDRSPGQRLTFHPTQTSPNPSG